MKLKVFQNIARPSAVLLSILIFPVLLSTQNSPQWKGKITKEGDVTVVRNPKEPMYKQGSISLKELWAIGGEGADLSVENMAPISLGVDADENVFVADAEEFRIIVFDRKGKYIRAFGKKGQGPGEFIFIGPISICYARREVFINDMGRNAIFSFEGKFIENISKKNFSDFSAMDSTGHFVTRVTKMKNSGTYSEIEVTDRRGNLIAALGRSPVTDRRVSSSFSLNLMFQTLVNGQIAIGYDGDYRIRIFGPDYKLKKEVRREYDPVEFTQKEKDRMNRGSPPGSPSRARIDSLKNHTAFQSFFGDDRGWLYVNRWEQDKQGLYPYYDVFDGEGRYLTVASLAAFIPVWRHNAVYGIERDDDGYWIIKKYGLTWNLK